jgi:hypothetical protein
VREVGSAAGRRPALYARAGLAADGIEAGPSASFPDDEPRD